MYGRRRASVESGATMNYEEASTKAMAGSTYCDDKVCISYAVRTQSPDGWMDFTYVLHKG